MTEQCPTPKRECPFDSDVIGSMATMEAKINEMHELLVNGEGLVSRVGKLEVSQGRFLGGLILLGVLAPIVTALAMKVFGVK